MVTAVVIIRCHYCCGERYELSLRRWVIHRVPWRLRPPALRRRLLCVPAPSQLSRARGPPLRRQQSVRLCLRMTWPRGPDRLRPNSRGSMRALTNICEISATTSSSREVATTCADHVANFDIILCQFVENISHRVASRDDGDAQERQREKAQLTTEMATWNKEAVDYSRANPPEPRGLSR